ncbi:peroxiredoxin family protein [Flagellimonas meridianipacifica]|uniref:Peroxiredoxin n=1 Tax=Flagellimonas meridianipacifica TaxID=1080225 RepID=A0A2T0MAM8_9FLAO|nr:TlpA disulfide reductase family protein [Allomuricauda pacifica]PRX54557.1 peroxiredoxin [Allomuricauda pacifica]
MKRRALLLLVTVFMAWSCKKEEKGTLPAEGDWWAIMQVDEKEQLPFNFTLEKQDESQYRLEMYNADEVVVVDEISFSQDSIRIQMPVFEGYISGTFTENEIKGSFIKESLDRVVPFEAFHGKRDRFLVEKEPTENISGVWETYFEPGTVEQYAAKGLFVQQGNKIEGTFRTTTGDYRFLEGVVDGDSLKLSTFDGAHVFLFTAKIDKDSLEGVFYSGNHSKEKFIAKRNEAFELPDANSLTYLKEGYETFDFSFPDGQGSMVSLQDSQFENKPVVVQIMGSWCPNCLDETKFYVDYLEQNPDLEIEFIGLAFEYAKTEDKAWNSINRLKDRINIPYPILLAQYGTSNKKLANEKLPMLNHVLSYPTTIFIDSKGDVKKIHTGFNGPATGKKYEEYIQGFEKTIKELTQDEAAAI